MGKTTRDVMTPAAPAEAERPTAEGRLLAGGAVGADDLVDDALRAMIERGTRSLAVIDGHEIIGSVTQGALAISIEDSRTWSALCS